jgi:hypothetical protein
MPLPTCECVNGLPTQQQLGFIYCALLEILAGQGGDITLSQISDLDASWIPPLQAPITTIGQNLVSFANPPGDSVLLVGNTGSVQPLEAADLATFVQGSLSISASQISDATAPAQGLLTTLPAGDPAGSYVKVDDAGGSSVATVTFSGNGLTNVDVTDGLVTAGT